MSKSKTPGWTDIRSELSQLPKDGLMALLRELYRLNADNKVFLATRLGMLTDEEIVEPYREIIREEFNPAYGLPEMRLRTARKAVNDFKKASSDPGAVVDLMLYYVEQGVICTNNYGDIDESFYNSHESMYVAAMDLLNAVDDPELYERFRPRAEKIVQDTRGIGWGFHDALADEFYSKYPYPDE
ncbi:MAG: hypothetical protein KDE53_37840 [Caldilineaceae bacterium]|nr:hypothetical protein [Caldilineaceae bacterium]MCB0128516.1 hypothetical protein [Caldilineaceae bacterium]